jgi:hypothetical protein
VVIVIVPPRLDGLSRLGERKEHVPVEEYRDPASGKDFDAENRLLTYRPSEEIRSFRPCSSYGLDLLLIISTVMRGYWSAMVQ